MNEPRCCFLYDGQIPCINKAEWLIVHGPAPDDYTHACESHVGGLLTDAPEHRIYPTEYTLECKRLLGESWEAKANRLIKESGKAVHSNTCATSIAPAEEPGPCDCDAALRPGGN